MSDQNNPAAEPEYLGAEPARTTGGRRRWGLVTGGAVAAVAVAGAGAWGLTQFLGGGPGAADAVPSDALAYLALDLDPGAGQKLEALRTLRKFPAVTEELGLDGEDDLRRWLFEAVSTDSPCEDLDFADDVDPWLGSRLAVAVRAGDDGPVPIAVVQVKDPDTAEAGLQAIADCAGEETPGHAFTGDYMVIAETDAEATRAARDAEEAALADVGGYQRWVEEAGGEGILTGYVSAEAPKRLTEALESSLGMTSAMSESYAGRTAALSDGPPDGWDAEPAPMPMTPMMPLAPGAEELAEAFEDFQGAALVVRFDDGALEVEMAAGGLPETAPSGGDSGLDDLPATTAIALGFGVPDDYAEKLVDSLSDLSGEDPDALLEDGEQETGLSLPEDLQTLLGEGVAVALDSSVDLSGVVSESASPQQVLGDVPVGLRIVGDPDEIEPVLQRLLEAVGAAGDVVVESGDGAVAVGLVPEHVAELAGDGELGGSDAFETALPGFDAGTGGLFVDFDAGDWLTGLAEEDAATAANLDPLSSLGVSGSVDGDVLHGTLRLTTD